MADVRCPMCGKLNPDDLDVCQFCQARLKPMTAPPQAEENSALGSKKSAEKNQELPDWLNTLRKSEPVEPTEYTEAEELPDWLAEQPEKKEIQESGEQSEEFPDWLSGLREETPQPEEQPEEDEDAAPVWGPEIEPAQEAQFPDWLDSLRSRSGVEEEEAAAGEKSALEGLDRTGPGFSLDEAEMMSAGEDQRVPPFDSEEDLSLEEGAEEATSDLSEWPSWLESTTPESPAEADSEEALPDWLKEIGQASPEEQETQEDQEIPDWLASGADGVIDAESSTTEDVEPEAETPEWLEESNRETGKLGEEGELPELPWEEETTSEGMEQEVAHEADTGELIPQAEEIPDWLAELSKRAEQVSADKPEEVEEQESQAELEPEIEVGPGKDELEWFKPVQDEEEQVSGGTFEPEPVRNDESIQKVAPFALDEEDDLLEPLVEGTLPDWLAGIGPGGEMGAEAPAEKDESLEPKGKGRRPRQAAPGRTPAGEEGEAGLTPAELPSWLEAMRPVEAAVVDAPPVDTSQNVVENVGPLTGLRGVLPAEPDISQIPKPPVYLNKLQVSDSQQANSRLFEQLIQREAEAAPVPKRSPISSQHVLRIAIAVLLITAIVWPMLMGGPNVDLPVFSNETGAAANLIDSLAPNAPVLLAVDYEPGWSGELDAAAGSVIDHLMVKGAFLATVTTNPSGPAQVERLLTNVNIQSGHQYLPGSQYANLGFIPGGSTGLVSFAQAPQQITPFDSSGQSAWGQEPLQSVKSLTDFAMAVIITEDPDNARAWIEQVKPYLGTVPVVMVISAQAEPLVKPFYEAEPKQVDGLVTGLAGGASYENLNGRLGLARTYWNSFSLGLVVAVLMVLIGGIVNVVTGFLAARKEETAGGSQV
jgi:hypothetical protein